MNDIVVSVTDASGITTTVTNGSTVSVAVAGNGDTVTVTIAQTGEKGNKGDTGPVGPPNSLSIGTVTKGDTASATITGAAPTQTLSLVLPKGDTGGQGPTGPSGPPNSLTIGTVTSGATASATITGEAPTQTLSLVLQKGDTGAAALWNFRGAYSGGEEYAVGDVATFNDETWYRINSNGGNVGDTPSEGTFWTRLAAKGSAGSAGSTGPAGPAGPTGPTGPTGPANSLSIGTVTTGAAGSSASATITGTAPTQTLSLSIPQGNTGAAGSPCSLEIGTVTTGAPGSSASATITGSAPNQTLSLTIPRGDAGSAVYVTPTAPTGIVRVLQADDRWLAWATIWDVRRYEVAVSTNDGGSYVTLDNYVLTPLNNYPQTQYAIPAAYTNTRYRWRVRAITDLGGAGEWGYLDGFGPPTYYSDPQPITAKFANHTLQQSDVGTLLTFSATGSGELIITIPSSSAVLWEAGAHIDIVRIGSAGVRVAGSTGVSVFATPGPSLRDVGSAGTLVFLGSNQWLLVGDLA